MIHHTASSAWFTIRRPLHGSPYSVLRMVHTPQYLGFWRTEERRVFRQWTEDLALRRGFNDGFGVRTQLTAKYFTGGVHCLNLSYLQHRRSSYCTSYQAVSVLCYNSTDHRTGNDSTRHHRTDRSKTRHLSRKRVFRMAVLEKFRK
jgi:hypothetical protein